jgi:hypothetical protein
MLLVSCSANAFKIIRNDMPENMKNFAFCTALSTIESGMDYNQSSQKLSTELNKEFGSSWLCFVKVRLHGETFLKQVSETKISKKIKNRN